MKAHLTLQLFDGRVLEVFFDQSEETSDKAAYRMMIDALTMQLDAQFPGGRPLNETRQIMDLSQALLARISAR